MASAPASLLAPSLCLPPAPALWGWAPAESASASPSPSSSPDSFSSPPAPAPAAAAAAAAAGHGPGPPPPCPGRRARAGCGAPRRSASEREKLRMRTLARALRTLRRFLPPALAPAGQSLTKVETLRLASRYIAHLSALLGPRAPAQPWGAPPRRAEPPAFCSAAAGPGAAHTRPWAAPAPAACCQVGHTSPARDSAQLTHSPLQSAQAWPQEWWS